MTSGDSHIAKEARTQLGSEARLAPFVAALQVLCLGVGIWMLWVSWATAARLIWVAAFVAWAFPTSWNLYYWVSHRKTTIGMMPPALTSLVPVTALTLAYAGVTGVVRIVLWATLVASLIVTVTCAVWFFRLRAASMTDEEVASDATIIVLGGTIRDGRPCPTLELRLDEAERLWRESSARKLILTGGAVPNDSKTEADYMAEDLIARGIPCDALLLERSARNTAQNVNLSLELIRASGINGQICVLTSDYHLYRACFEGRRNGVELVPVPCPTPPASRLQQWSREVLAILF